MSVGPMGGIIGSAAGAPMSQTAGNETEKAQKESKAVERQVDTDSKADKAAGIGETEQDQQASERDADGRRLWEPTSESGKEEANEETNEQPSTKPVKDPTGNRGNSLDLTG